VSIQMVKQAGLVRLSGTRISMVEPRGSEEEKQFVRLQSCIVARLWCTHVGAYGGMCERAGI